MKLTESNTSCLYEGIVRHRRATPVEHEFSYSIYYLYLDLRELPTVFARRWLWSTGGSTLASWHREDHLGDPSVPLDVAVRELVQSRTGARPAGPIRLLTHPRYFGYGFNPVSFYYCFDESDEHVQAVVAEINNTPWGEQYCYVLDARLSGPDAGKHRWLLGKEFHVSPFMGMNVTYDWRFVDPGESLAIHMVSLEGGEHLFDATLTLRRREMTGRALAWMLVRHPFVSARVVSAIYWQALRLKLKKIPFHEHPKWKTAPSDPIP